MVLGITGDTHGELNFTKVYKARKLGCTHLIVCGDFGYVWTGSDREQRQLNYLNKIGVEILFVAGNHENYNLLETYPIEDRYNGKVKKIRDNIYQLMNGEIYTINNKTFFVMGGANSTDKEYRIENKTWWKQEVPSDDIIRKGIINLNECNNKVNYILTHTCYPEALSWVGGEYRADDYSNKLEYFKEFVDFDYWYFGHMHIDYNILCLNTRCLYNDIVEVK